MESMSRNSFMPFNKALGRSLNRFTQRPSLLYTLLWRNVMLIFMQIWQTFTSLILGQWWTDEVVCAYGIIFLLCKELTSETECRASKSLLTDFELNEAFEISH